MLKHHRILDYYGLQLEGVISNEVKEIETCSIKLWPI